MTYGSERAIEENIHKLLALKSNFNKNPFRNYRRLTLTNELARIKVIHKEITELFTANEAKFDSTKLNVNTKLSRKLYCELTAACVFKIKKYQRQFQISFNSKKHNILFKTEKF